MQFWTTAFLKRVTRNQNSEAFLNVGKYTYNHIEEYKFHLSTKCNEFNNAYNLNPNACVGYISTIRFLDMETNWKSDVQQTGVILLAHFDI